MPLNKVALLLLAELLVQVVERQARILLLMKLKTKKPTKHKLMTAAAGNHCEVVAD